MGGGFGGFGDRGPRPIGGREDCPHASGWEPAPAPAGAPKSSGGGFGSKPSWWKCNACGMMIESRSRPQAEDFEPGAGDDEDED